MPWSNSNGGGGDEQTQFDYLWSFGYDSDAGCLACLPAREPVQNGCGIQTKDLCAKLTWLSTAPILGKDKRVYIGLGGPATPNTAKGMIVVFSP